jgi:hypothetical protein
VTEIEHQLKPQLFFILTSNVLPSSKSNATIEEVRRWFNPLCKTETTQFASEKWSWKSNGKFLKFPTPVPVYTDNYFYSTWRTIWNHDFSQYACYITFFDEDRDRSIDTSCRILLPYSGPALNCFQHPYSCIPHTVSHRQFLSVV